MTETIDVQALVAEAEQARELAHAPYSGYAVGAALLCGDGATVLGCNIENAVYPATCCAERVAIFKAIVEGRRDFVAIAVSTANGGAPCGICRQVMREFAPDMDVYISDTDGAIRQTTVAELLPDSFGPEDLGYFTETD